MVSSSPSKERASTCSRSGMVKPPYGSMPGMGSLRVDGEIVWEILFHLKIGRAQSLCIGLQLGMADHHFDHQERPDDRRTPELVYKGSSDLARAQSTLRLSCKS